MEQKHPADIFNDALDYLWEELGLGEKGWKRLKKGDFKKRAKKSHGNVEAGYQLYFRELELRFKLFPEKKEEIK